MATSRTFFNWVWVGLLSITLSSCKKDIYFNTNIIIAGHAGAGFDIHENPMNNTVEAVQFCIANGGDAVEIDFQQSLDGTNYAFHDQEIIDGLTICNLTDNEIEALENTPDTFQSIVDAMPSNTLLIIDLKQYFDCFSKYDTTALKNDLLYAKSNGVNVNFVLGTTSIIPFLTSLNEYPIYYEGTSNQNSLEVCQLYNLEGVCGRNKNYSTEDCNNAQEEGLKVMLYDIRSKESYKNAIKKNINIMLVDNISQISNF